MFRRSLLANLTRLVQRVRAKRRLRKTLGPLRREGRGAELARALKQLGELERWWDPDAARRYYEESVAIFRELDEPLELAHTIRHLGDVHYEAGRAALAEPCYHEALALYRDYEHTPSLNFANAMRSLAVLKDDAGEIEQAARLWQETHALYVAVAQLMGVAESAAHLALLTRRQDDRQRSREWLSEAAAAADASRDADSLTFVREVSARLQE